MPAKQRPTKTKPEPPASDVEKKIDERHTDADFFRDLEKASSDDAREGTIAHDHDFAGLQTAHLHDAA